jgi:uncharacterized protein
MNGAGGVSFSVDDREADSSMNLQAHARIQVVEIENLFIELSDGCRLAARIWMPADAEEHPVPAILEYVPYRKRDGTAPRDQTMHPAVAAHGYACVRVDIRGNGESDGLMHDEYLAQELEDGAEIISWIAAQPWCSGNVGMLGISWGGFNGLQVAALRPPALKAVITLCSTDDRYADDIHYRGGCLLNDNLGWSAAMMAFSSRPPDPAIVGEHWREMWMDRLRNMPFLAANWLEHQRRDEFWKHGSVCEDFSDIEVPVLAVGGWADAYTNAIPRIVEGLGKPSAGLIGPWGHKYPQIGVPGPAMDFVSEMVRWWDRWLLQRPGPDLPAMRAYILDGPDQGDGPDERAGFWVSEPSWPSPNIYSKPLFLRKGGVLAATETEEEALQIASPPNTGLCGGRFYAKIGRPDLPIDQRPDDGCSLLFDSEPLGEPLVLLGAPLVELEIASDRPRANIAVRLCHVAPDGASHRISIGVLNLAHRESHEKPALLEPGRRYRISVQLDDVGYRVPAGHRLRIAVSTEYWPMIWPAPEPVTLTVFAGSGRLELPVRREAGQEKVEIAPAALVDFVGFEMVREPRSERRICKDLITGETIIEHTDDGGLKRFVSHALESGLAGTETYVIGDSGPSSAEARTHWTAEVGRGDWRIRTVSTSAMRADRESFFLEAELIAFEGDDEVFRHRWERRIPRDHV